MKTAYKILNLSQKNIDIRLFVLFISITVSWFIFETSILKYIDHILKNVYINKDNLVANEFFIISIYTFITLTLLIKITTRYAENKMTIFTIITIGYIYTYYRHFDNKYDFLRFSFYNKIAYLDITIILFIYSIIILFISLYKELKLYKHENHQNTCTDNSLLSDNPIKNISEDLLNRAEGVKNIVNRINNYKCLKSFSLGIMGTWGEGKTSFINMIRSELEKTNRYIIINFNPWASVDHTTLQKDFLLLLKNELSLFSSEIKPSLSKYINTLSKQNNNKLLNIFFDLYKEESEILKESTDNALQKIDKKIIIFIDDIDRLDKNEIQQLLKLIRNTANFKNTFFISAYDKEYITTALNEIIPYNNENFLEKIFQHEIPLPYYPYSKLKTILINHLKDFYKDNNIILSTIQELIDNDSDSLLTLNEPKLSCASKYFIQNIRDVIRIYNSFVHSFTPIMEEVELIDFFYLELLKVKAFKVYRRIKFREFLNDSFINYEFDLEKYDNHYKDNDSLANKSIKDILIALFPQNPDSKSKKSVCHKKYFRAYFSDTIFNRLPIKEFNNLLRDTDGNTINCINQWIKQGLSNDVNEYVQTTPLSFFVNKNEIIKYLDICFHLIRINHFSDINYLSNILLTETEETLISNNQQNISQAINEYITNIFNNAKPPYFEVTLIGNILKRQIRDNSRKFIYSKKNLQDYAIKYLMEHTEKTNKFDDIAYFIYTACIDKTDDNNKVLMLPEASKIAKKYIQKDPNYYLDHYIKKLTNGSDSESFGDPYADRIFDGYDNFLDYLNKCDNYINIDKIKRFFSAFKLNNFNPFYFNG